MVKMLKNTKYDGKGYFADEEYSVHPKIENFWVKNDIAEKIDEPDVGEISVPDTLYKMSDDDLFALAEKLTADTTDVKSKDDMVALLDGIISKMTVANMKKYAEANGIDVSQAKSKQDYVKAILNK